MKIKTTPFSKFLLFSFLLPVIFYFACSDSTNNKNLRPEIIKKSKPSAFKPPSSMRDSLLINTAAAVFFSPDSLQLKKISSVTDPKDFDGNMHEYFYMIRNAHLVIKKNKPLLKIIDAKNIRYLLFNSKDKRNIYIDLDTKHDPYGLFLFDGQKPPVFVDMANIDTELGFYFSK